jgi:hypothetical protein
VEFSEVHLIHERSVRRTREGYLTSACSNFSNEHHRWLLSCARHVFGELVQEVLTELCRCDPERLWGEVAQQLLEWSRKVLELVQGRMARGLRSETEDTMSNSISTLLLRNLSDVFGENDPVRRRAAIDEIFHEDAAFYDPKSGIFRGRDEIDRIAGVIKATHPDFKYQPLFPPEELGDAGRVRWVSGTPGKAPAYAGTDFIVARGGRIASLYLFFDDLP